MFGLAAALAFLVVGCVAQKCPKQQEQTCFEPDVQDPFTLTKLNGKTFYVREELTGTCFLSSSYKCPAFQYKKYKAEILSLIMTDKTKGVNKYIILQGKTASTEPGKYNISGTEKASSLKVEMSWRFLNSTDQWILSSACIKTTDVNNNKSKYFYVYLQSKDNKYQFTSQDQASINDTLAPIGLYYKATYRTCQNNVV